MNDYDRFREFFDKMGISYLMPDNVSSDGRIGEEPPESIFLLGPSQTYFCFDKDKKYIGMVGDENGFFESRSK